MSQRRKTARAHPDSAPLQALRHGLLRLHKSLIDHERAQYERTHGRVDAAGFYNLLVSDEGFAWLRPLTALIVAIDERLDLEEAVTAGDLAVFTERTQLLVVDPGNEEFGPILRAAIQHNPDVALANGQVTRALGLAVDSQNGFSA